MIIKLCSRTKTFQVWQYYFNGEKCLCCYIFLWVFSAPHMTLLIQNFKDPVFNFLGTDLENCLLHILLFSERGYKFSKRLAQCIIMHEPLKDTSVFYMLCFLTSQSTLRIDNFGENHYLWQEKCSCLTQIQFTTRINAGTVQSATCMQWLKSIEANKVFKRLNRILNCEQCKKWKENPSTSDRIE